MSCMGIMELSYKGTFIPRNENSMGGTFVPWNFRSQEPSPLELLSPRVKFAWNFRSQTLRLLFYIGILSIKAIESSRAIKTFSVIVFVQVSYAFYVDIGYYLT